MSSKTLCGLLRAAVIVVAICGVAVCCFILPAVGKSFSYWYPEFAHAYVPWLVFLWVAALPVFAVLALIWRASAAVGHDRVFTAAMARLVKYGAMCVFGDTVYFCAGNIVLLLLGMNHPAIVLASLFIGVLGMSMTALMAVLSRHLTKAAALQEEVDGTI
ncbi:MAG: DUF2975 domain-containing protein [Oscillospiraceae bacterium]|nr:DUF2975 domain-containing protein [Oscillospiraceae bacterium]